MNHISYKPRMQEYVKSLSLYIVGRAESKMEDNKMEIELSKDRKSYAGIPEADFVVSVIY